MFVFKSLQAFEKVVFTKNRVLRLRRYWKEKRVSAFTDKECVSYVSSVKIEVEKCVSIIYEVRYVIQKYYFILIVINID